MVPSIRSYRTLRSPYPVPSMPAAEAVAAPRATPEPTASSRHRFWVGAGLAGLGAATAVCQPVPPQAAAPLPIPQSQVDQAHQEVIDLTQQLVRIDSGPDNRVAGENQTVDAMERFADQAGLQVQRFETHHHKPCLIVTLPGSRPDLGSVGFVHHSDVVGTEGTWKMAPPFSGAVVKDEYGRPTLVGRGVVDTKGPAAQILVAMKHLKQSQVPVARSMKLFIFPDEEIGGADSAWSVAKEHPEVLRDVQYWVSEASGVLSHQMLADVPHKGQPVDVPFLAVAQKYSIPVEIEMKQAEPPDQALRETLQAMQRLNGYLDHMQWTYLGNRTESNESFARMGKYIGGLRGWAVRNFYRVPYVQRQLGPTIAATNRTDGSKTDLYLSTNPGGSEANPNVKPSSTTVLLKLGLSGDARARAIRQLAQAAGPTFRVEDAKDGVRLSLPQENYHGTSHGSITDRTQDAIDVTNQALDRVLKAADRQGFASQLQLADYWTSKSVETGQPQGQVKTRLVLDLRFQVDDDRQKVIN
ncbi:MAG: M20/M25/M40 family metallo-hydrolase, partial [Candidatus Xenobia bacterium]